MTMNFKKEDLASPWLRLLAFLVDFLIGLIILVFFVWRISQGQRTDEVLTRTLEFVTYGIVWLGMARPLFESYLMSKIGGSIGQLLAGLRVMRVDGKGLTFWQAAFRTYVGNMTANVLLGLGYFWVFRDSNRQGWHDMVSDTVVVVKNKTGTLLAVGVVVGLMAVIFALIGMAIGEFQKNSQVYSDFAEIITEEINTSEGE